MSEEERLPAPSQPGGTASRVAGGTASRVAAWRSNTPLRDQIAVVAAGVILLLIASDVVSVLQDPRLPLALGGDFHFYLDATRRWLVGGGYFSEYQLAGPYVTGDFDVLFPPVALVLFVPFTVLPEPLWWIVPLGVVGACCWRLRPVPWAWVAILAALWWAPTEALIVAGNPVMWCVAALALGTLFAWPAVLVFIKPSLFPLAFFGSWRRSWWIGLTAYLALSALFLPLWVEYVTALGNATGPRASLLRSVPDIPFMLVPLIAWVGRQRSGIPAPSLRFLRR